MAIAFDNSEVTTYNAGVSSLTFSHTTSGSDRLLIVNAGIWTNAGRTITGVTYNGVSMTEINHTSADANNSCYMFYLLNPAEGNHDVVISASNTSDLWGASASYTGVAQSNQPDDTNSGNGSGDPCQGSVTTTADNCWHIMCNYGNGGGDGQTAGSGTTLRENQTATGCVIADSNGPKTPAGSNTLTTNGLTGSWCEIDASFSPIVSVVTEIFIPKIIII